MKHPINIKDHFLTNESFEVYWDEAQTLGATQGVDHDQLHLYYKSEDYLSHQKDRSDLKALLYKLAQKAMLRYKMQKLSPHLFKHARVLDYGCGVGAFLTYLNQKGYKVQGVEPITSARKIAQEQGIAVFQALPQDTTYDMITLWHVLEHIPDPKEALHAFYKHLTPKGTLVLALPNPSSWDAQYYAEYWAGWDVPRHLWHFTPEGIKKMAASAGFTLEKQHPLWLDAFYVSLLSETYQNKKAPWLGAMVKGFLSNLRGIKTGQFSSLIYVFKKS